MVRVHALAVVLASLAVDVHSVSHEDDTMMIQAQVLREVEVTKEDTFEATGASLIGQGAAAFAGVVQAIAYEMTMAKHFAELSVAGEGAAEPSPSKCTFDERERANNTVVKLASEMLSGKASMTTVMNSAPSACPKDPMAIAAMAMSGGNFGSCMQQLLGVSAPCSGCMVSFISRARSCIPRCIPMLTGCGNPTAWSHDMDPSACPAKSSACLSCNMPYLKEMTECSGALPAHHDEYFKFLDGAVNLVKEGVVMDSKKLKDYVVQFVKSAKGN